jgi:hypothetical protein
MSNISTIGAASVSKPVQPQAVPPRPGRVDQDGDRDGSRPSSTTGTGRRLDITV